MQTPQQIEQYLKKHPSFFVDRVDLLALLDLPVALRGQSFQQRQLAALRNRETNQRTRLEQVLDSVETQQQLELKLHALAVDLLSSGSVPARPRTTVVADTLQRHFNLAQVRVLLASQAAESNVDYAALLPRVAHLSSSCDNRLAAAVRAALFAAASDAVASCAFVPLVFQQHLHGILVLGDSDATRFKPGMGVLILDRLGQLLGAYLCAP